MTTIPPAVILLDIEGTTTPISFVYEVLFPYARTRMKAFLEIHANDEGRRDLDLLLSENRADIAASFDAPAISGDTSQLQIQIETSHAYLLWLMDRDRKSPALKAIQGRIWESGYASGALRSIVFPDVPNAFERWRGQGSRIAIYSSGSVLAQKLIFGHTQAGDLTPQIEAYFDTGVGAKTQSISYQNIVAALGVSPQQVLFVSDVPAELDAATEAGLQVRLALRPGNRPVPSLLPYIAVTSFDEL